MSEPSSTAFAGLKTFNDFPVCDLHWQKHQLRDTGSDFDGVGRFRAIPAGHKNLSLVVAVYQADEVS
jgi:hypothetical protein